MERVAAQLYDWLRRHNLDPDKVKMVLRADDEVTEHYVKAAVKSDLKSYQLNRECDLADLRGLKIHGIGVSFSHLDKR